MRFTRSVTTGLLPSLLYLAASIDASKYSSEYGLVQFANLGYSGTYYKVKSIDSSSDDSCTCELNRDEPYSFSGTNAPLDEELSVHIRGPLNLQKFAYYTSDSYSYGDTSGNWSRLAYYDSESGTADNVTFLANVGKNITCLGKALDYIDSDGISAADSSTVLGNVTLESNEEFTIMSNISCEDSGWDNDCGVYRKGIPAYHGYGGEVKMFLFKFRAPLQSDLDSSVDEDSTSYDLSAIWLLNANIPRTAQYPTNGNCSSWNSGGGEFDIFETMNSTENRHFYSTIHDFQGIGDIGTGIQNYGYLERTPDSVMMGGVVFGSDGVVSVFLSNSTTFDSDLSSSDVSSWMSAVVSADEEKVETLATIAVASSTTTSSSSSKGGAVRLLTEPKGFQWKLVSVLLGLLAMV
ncbi:hypothetical protein CANARDRAFT_54981 [[Candida] arabinofermentans NRRL YB-2248]|uniref:glucan endo-1,3-beta-D-glucosidase n=1 Tax=[Candida] arabinofermentans NRRL YB-2248 TaxID=983967 RepID=A0A1E4T892_9ASCO|nr:hypothetical protein CANARDRAFT_54981 [[Candida] arabinofermentans NRRL YB-2248]